MQSRKVVLFVARASLAAVFGLLVSGVAVGENVEGTQVTQEAPVTRAAPLTGVSSACPGGGHTYTSARSKSVRSHRTASSACTPDKSRTYRPAVIVKSSLNAPRVLMLFTRTQNRVAAGTGNTFPYGACTWYADQRYHELHGAYVPWRGNAYAWPQGAYAYGWRVSSAPSVGSIIALQSGVQGASGMGHVGIVEQIEGNGNIVASSMNWGENPSAVTRWQFHPGPGVTFLSQ